VKIDPAIDCDEVRRLADLAQLELDADEVAAFTAQLGAILDYAQRLQAVDTTGVAPTAQLEPTGTARRADEATASLGAAAALDQAPAVTGHYFAVPPFVDQQ